VGSDDDTAPISLDTEVLDGAGNVLLIEGLAADAYKTFVEAGGWAGSDPLPWHELAEKTRRRWRAVITRLADRLVPRT
jgi:hypothetical protein